MNYVENVGLLNIWCLHWPEVDSEICLLHNNNNEYKIHFSNSVNFSLITKAKESVN